MAYSTVEDLKNYLPASQLVEMTDDSDTGEIGLEKLNDVIRRADDLIDSFLRGRYPLPLTTIPSFIHDISTKLASYFLFKRALILTLPEPVKEDYENCLDILMKIQKGQVSPFEKGQEPTFFLSNRVATDSVITSASVTNDWNAYLI
jgi:phage gp36-like protein